MGPYYLCFVVFLTNVPKSILTVTTMKLNEQGVCTKGYFQCVNDTTCVPQESNCDGKIDCDSGSDEMDCKDELKDNYFDHLFRKQPSAEHDDLDPTCQLNRNGSCLCRTRDVLCRHKKWNTVPNDFNKNESIDIFDLYGNNFRVLSYETLENLPPDINKLIMAHCNVNELSPKAFQNLTLVNYLSLDNNFIKEIPENLFPEGTHLETLSLMYNHISLIHKNAFTELQNLIQLDLRGNKLTEVRREYLEPLQNLERLYLQDNVITHINKNTFPELPLTELSLIKNKIERLEKGTFRNLYNLSSLFLSNNDLTVLHDGTFENLSNLKVLNLNYNFITIIEDNVFKDVPLLTSLSLQKNQLRTLNKEVLEPLKDLPYIYFDRFELCSAASHVRVCEPKGDGISSREHLLDNPVLRASVWVMGAIGCMGNLIVLLNRLLAPTNNLVHSLYLRNLALSDLLMGVYLFIIATADLHYRGNYLRHQYVWRHSYVCNLCGFLSTLSCESSVLILTLVTWDRFVSVTQPLARKQPSPRTAALTLVVLWLIAASVALIPMITITQNYFGNEFYSSNGVCLSLHIHEPYAQGWEYSATMFILVNALALAFICYAYLRMIHEIKASGVACRSTRQSQERDNVAKRFGIIVFTDCLCWVPIIIVKLVALSGTAIPQTLYAWLAIFILPINSALNPVLYTLTTTMFKKQVKKVVDSCVYKKDRKREHQHSASDSACSLSLPFLPGPKKLLSYKGTQSSVTSSKNSWKRQSTAV